MSGTIVHHEAAALQPQSGAGQYFYSRYQSSGYWDGFQAYCKGLTLDTLTTDAERAGWWGANKAEAAASMPARDDYEYSDDIPSRVEGGEWVV